MNAVEEILSDLTSLERVAYHVAVASLEAKNLEISRAAVLALLQYEKDRLETSVMEEAYRMGVIDGKNAEQRKVQADYVVYSAELVSAKQQRIIELKEDVAFRKAEAEHAANVLKILMEAMRREREQSASSE